MRFKHFLENVIDSEDEFKKKRSKDFEKKIKDVTDKIPNVLQYQRNLEKHIVKKVNK